MPSIQGIDSSQKIQNGAETNPSLEHPFEGQILSTILEPSSSQRVSSDNVVLDLTTQSDSAVKQSQDPVIVRGEINAGIVRNKVHIGVRMEVFITMGTLITVASIISSTLYQGTWTMIIQCLVLVLSRPLSKNFLCAALQPKNDELIQEFLKSISGLPWSQGQLARHEPEVLQI